MKSDTSSLEQSCPPWRFCRKRERLTRRQTDAILTSPQLKDATPLVLSLPELEIREWVGFRCSRIPQPTSIQESAPEHSLSTTRITTLQLGREHCFSTPLARRTLPSAVTHWSITTAALRTTPLAQMRSLAMWMVSSTMRMVVTRLQTIRAARTMRLVIWPWQTTPRGLVTQP